MQADSGDKNFIEKFIQSPIFETQEQCDTDPFIFQKNVVPSEPQDYSLAPKEGYLF